VSYGFYADPFEDGSYRIFEEWADQDAVDAHMSTDHMAAFMGAIGDFGVTGIDLNSYQASNKTKFM
jgi:quinol monooxygenase YgiN